MSELSEPLNLTHAKPLLTPGYGCFAHDLYNLTHARPLADSRAKLDEGLGPFCACGSSTVVDLGMVSDQGWLGG